MNSVPTAAARGLCSATGATRYRLVSSAANTVSRGASSRRFCASARSSSPPRSKRHPSDSSCAPLTTAPATVTATTATTASAAATADASVTSKQALLTSQFTVQLPLSDLAHQAFFAMGRPLLELQQQQSQVTRSAESGAGAAGPLNPINDPERMEQAYAEMTSGSTPSTPEQAIESARNFAEYMSSLKPFELTVAPSTASAGQKAASANNMTGIYKRTFASRLPGMIPDEASIPEAISMGPTAAKYLPHMIGANNAANNSAGKLYMNTANMLASDIEAIVDDFFAAVDHSARVHSSVRRARGALLAEHRAQRHSTHHASSLMRANESLQPVSYELTSIQRKRRKKMNKHKYKKLRKRQRALRRRLGK
ncbi:hypothetical protein GQ42DRAFT_155930 [Ramicandelaber brevisporus]|nr:hypothetical protein GQ42DRAFT_155930 [Ramicandelaber brevisporus]